MNYNRTAVRLMATQGRLAATGFKQYNPFFALEFILGVQTCVLGYFTKGIRRSV